jgi:hypothetical protein
MNSESELIKALQNMVVTVDPPIEYRLHYNDRGDIVMCTMQQHPESTDYLVVTKEQYDLYHRYCVVKGKLTLIEHDAGLRVALVTSDRGFKVVKNHAALLLENEETFKDIEYYDYRNR